MKHKHYDVIMAYTNGEKIEVKTALGNWEEIETPTFYEALEYRVKKEPQKEVYGFNVYQRNNNGLSFSGGNIETLDFEKFNLKLTFTDGELTKAEIV